MDTLTSFGYWLRRRRKALDLIQAVSPLVGDKRSAAGGLDGGRGERRSIAYLLS